MKIDRTELVKELNENCVDASGNDYLIETLEKFGIYFEVTEDEIGWFCDED